MYNEWICHTSHCTCDSSPKAVPELFTVMIDSMKLTFCDGRYGTVQARSDLGQSALSPFAAYK